jgi:hypothetical protein
MTARPARAQACRPVAVVLGGGVSGIATVPCSLGAAASGSGMSWFREVFDLQTFRPYCAGDRAGRAWRAIQWAQTWQPQPLRSLATEVPVIILGIILILLGLIVSSLHWLLIIGVILLIVGLVLNFVPIGGTRRRYY